MKKIGQELRQKRERNGKQLSDVWRALKIRPNFLAAIEEGRFEDLPGRAFTIGYVGRYARYLQLDVENLRGRLEAEIAAHGGIFNERIDSDFSDCIDSKPLPNRPFRVLGMAIAGLLLAALIYSREDIVSLAARTFEQATEESLAQKDVDLISFPFDVAATQPVSLRPEFLPPLPVIAVTREVSVRSALLPPIPVIAVTRPVSLRADLTPAAIQQQTRLAPLFLPMPSETEVSVTPRVFLRPDLAPPAVRQTFHAAIVPVPSRIAVTPSVALGAELLPQRVQAQLPRGRRYGLRNGNSRITLRVHRPTVVAIRDRRNRIFIDRKLAPGDTYRVPNLIGLWLTAIDGGAVEIVLDGASVGFAGTQGAAVTDQSLNPESIADQRRTNS